MVGRICFVNSCQNTYLGETLFSSVAVTISLILSMAFFISYNEERIISSGYGAFDISVRRLSRVGLLKGKKFRVRNRGKNIAWSLEDDFQSIRKMNKSINQSIIERVCKTVINNNKATFFFKMILCILFALHLFPQNTIQ